MLAVRLLTVPARPRAQPLSRVNFPNIFQKLIRVTALNRLNGRIVSFDCRFLIIAPCRVATPIQLTRTELVSHVITNLKRGKAAGIDGLSAEHLLFCHPALSVVLAKLFRLMMRRSYVQDCFDTVMLYSCLNRKTILVNPYCVMIVETLLLVPSYQKYLNTVFLIGYKIIW